MIPSFHAHIYYTPDTRQIATAVREELGEKFTVVLGRWHDEPVGPHPDSMYQVAFKGDQFDGVTQWLMLNRRGLTVFLHPETGDAMADHRDNALWMGEILPLNFEALKKFIAEQK